MMKPINILLIDDDAISSWLNQTMLEKSPLVASVTPIFDGQTALDLLKECCSDPMHVTARCPDLILLDLDMPVMDGFDVLESLQKSRSCSWLISDRLIVLTTSINPNDLERAKAYHILDFLVKPLTETKISEVLTQYIQTKSTGRTEAGGTSASSLPPTPDREPQSNISAPNVVKEENSNKS